MNIYYSLTYTFICIICKNNKNLVKCVDPIPGEQNQENTSNSSKSSYDYPHGIKIITEGSKVPNDASKFEFRKSEPDEGHFIFRKNAHCTEVRVDATLWKGRSGDRYPSAISYDSNEISINFPDKLFVFKKENGIWQSSEFQNKTITSSAGSSSKRSEPLPITHIDPKHKIFIQSLEFNRFNLDNNPALKSQLNSLDKIKLINLVALLVNKVMNFDHSYDFKECVDNYLELHNTYGPVLLNLDLRESVRFDRTVDFTNQIITFTCKEDQPFNLIKKRDMVIWHTLNPAECLQKVEWKGEKLTLYDLFGNTKEVPIKPINEAKFIPNASESDSSDGSVSSDNITPQTSGSGRRDSLSLYGFDQKTEALSEDNSQEIDIFDHNNSYTLYKVTDETLHLWTTLFDEDYFQLYYQRTSEGKILLGLYSIPDDFGFQDPSQYQFPIDLNYVTLDVENKETTKYIIYSFDNTYNKHVFSPKFSYLITSIVKGGEAIWEHDNDDIAPYPMSVGFKENDSVYIDYDDYYFSYTKNDQGKWIGEKHSYPELEDGENDELKMIYDDSSSVEDESGSNGMTLGIKKSNEFLNSIPLPSNESSDPNKSDGSTYNHSTFGIININEDEDYKLEATVFKQSDDNGNKNTNDHSITKRRRRQGL